MHKTKKKIFATVLTLAVLSTSSVGVLAAKNFWVSYNTSSGQELTTLAHGMNTAQPLSINTRPTEGRGGARVRVTDVYGYTKSQKVFPYFETVADLKTTVPVGGVRKIKVEPVTKNQKVKGTLKYKF